MAASTHVEMLATLGFVASPDGFTGCEQAQKLVHWIVSGEPPEDGLMEKWTKELWSAIADLAAGKLPTNAS